MTSGSTVARSGASSEVAIPFDRVLLALGRKANVDGFGLRELGVVFNERGTHEYLSGRSPVAVQRTLEPYVMDQWRQPIGDWLPAHVEIREARHRTLFGGLYQMLTLTL